MKLQYLGHACFRLISEMGTTIVCDPYNSKMVGIDMPHVRCDVVTVSHQHDDHNCLDHVIGNPALLDEQITCAADDIAVDSITTFHDENGGKDRGKNVVFTFVVDGLTVAHLGDVGCKDPNVVQKLKGFDLIMLPVGGIFTVDAQVAKWYVDQIQPKIVVPMHYKTAKHRFEIAPLSDFVNLFDSADVVNYGDSLVLWDEPQNQTTKIAILQQFED